MPTSTFRRLGLALLLLAALTASPACFNAPKATEAIRRSRSLEVRGHFQTISVAVMSYATQQGSLPVADDIDGLAALLMPTYVRVLPLQDPWGEAYWFASDGSTWTVSSAGKDGAWDTKDDIEMVDSTVTKMPGEDQFK